MAVEAVNPRHILAHDFIKHAPLAEQLADGPRKGGPQDQGQTLHVDGQLQLVGLIHGDAVVVVGGEFGEKTRPEAHPDILHLHRVVLAHGDDLLPHGDDIPRLDQRDHIPAQHLQIAFAPLDKMGFHRVPLIARAVHHPDAAYIVHDAVFLPPVLRIVEIALVPYRHRFPALSFHIPLKRAGGPVRRPSRPQDPVPALSYVLLHYNSTAYSAIRSGISALSAEMDSTMLVLAFLERSPSFSMKSARPSRSPPPIFRVESTKISVMS